MRLVAIFLFALFAGAAVGCSGGGSSLTPDEVALSSPVANPTATPDAIVTSFEGKVMEFEVNLAINGSSQEGTAVFTRKDDYTQIALKMSPGVPVQLVTLRRGECPDPEGFVETLNRAIGGILRQEIRDFPFDDLLTGELTLVVSTDAASFNTFAACGDLPLVE